HIGDVPVIVFVVFVHERRLLFWMNSGKQGQTICFYDSKKGDGGQRTEGGRCLLSERGGDLSGNPKPLPPGWGKGLAITASKKSPWGAGETPFGWLPPPPGERGAGRTPAVLGLPPGGRGGGRPKCLGGCSGRPGQTGSCWSPVCGRSRRGWGQSPGPLGAPG